MDRNPVYAGAIPYETDILSAERYAYEGLGLALADILGTSTAVAGLACTATGPASLAVLVGPGRIYSLQALDGTAFGQISGSPPVGGLRISLIVGARFARWWAPISRDRGQFGA